MQQCVSYVLVSTLFVVSRVDSHFPLSNKMGCCFHLQSALTSPQGRGKPHILQSDLRRQWRHKQSKHSSQTKAINAHERSFQVIHTFLFLKQRYACIVLQVMCLPRSSVQFTKRGRLLVILQFYNSKLLNIYNITFAVISV